MNLHPPIIWFIPTHEQIYTHPIFGRQIYDKFLLCTFKHYFYDLSTLYLTLHYRSWRATTHLYGCIIYRTHKTPLTCNAIFRNRLLANDNLHPKNIVVYNSKKNAEKTTLYMQKTTQFSRLHTPINKSYQTTYQTYRHSQNTKKI